MSKIILFTNIDFIIFSKLEMRLETHAIVLETDPGHRPRLRGFGTSFDDPCFDLNLKNTEWAIFEGREFRIDGHEILIAKDDCRSPIHSDVFELPEAQSEHDKTDAWYEAHRAVYKQLSETVSKRVVEFWQSPNVGFRRWMSVSLARNAYKIA